MWILYPSNLCTPSAKLTGSMRSLDYLSSWPSIVFTSPWIQDKKKNLIGTFYVIYIKVYRKNSSHFRAYMIYICWDNWICSPWFYIHSRIWDQSLFCTYIRRAKRSQEEILWKGRNFQPSALMRVIKLKQSHHS